MKKFSLIKTFLFLIFFGFGANIFAQDADSLLYYDDAVGEGEIIEAGEALIKIEVEKPQVQLFSQRIKPEFDEVNLQKSFVKEILDEGQEITLQSEKERKRLHIEIDEILNKNR